MYCFIHMLTWKEGFRVMEMTSSELAQQIIEFLTERKFEQVEARLGEILKPLLPPGRLEATWQGIEAQLGAFQRIVEIKTVQTPQGQVQVATCAFERIPFDINLVFNTSAEIVGLTLTPVGTVEQQAQVNYEPPAYAHPDQFEEHEVQVGAGEWALPGTLSLPNGQGPFPAIVLVHGSGPNDRDETIPPNKPFRDLAWGLASNGIAVLRYEKRTRFHRSKLASHLATLTVQEETIEDALLALEVLRHQSAVDAQQLFLLGHSLGGYLLPRILKALTASDVRGGIILAGSARPLEDIILDQMSYISSLSTDTSEPNSQLEALAAQVARVKDPNLSPDTPSSELPFNVAATYWLDLRGYQPVQVACHLPQPLLILQAGSDYQVTQADFQLWQQALAERSDVTFKEYPNLNHLFMPSEPGKKATPASYSIAGHVTEEVINDISHWIKRCE